MIKKNQHMLNTIHKISDAVLVLVSYLLATWYYLDIRALDHVNMARFVFVDAKTTLLAILYSIILLLVLACCGLYRPMRTQRITGDCIRICVGNMVGILFVTAGLFVFRLVDFSRGVLLYFYLFSCLLLCGKRLLLRFILANMRRRGYNQKHVLVVGSGKLASEYAQNILENPAFGFSLDAHIGEKMSEDLPKYLGDFSTLERQLQGHKYDEVVVALEVGELSHINHIIATCEKCGMKTSIIPFYNDIIPNRPSVDVIGTVKLFKIRSIALDSIGNALVKRTFDILVSAIGLLLCSPVLLITAIGVKLSSPGPIFFKQKRVGRNKVPFSMYKFRSMRINTTQDTAWSKNVDNRKTKFGTFIRKYSLDELPQLFNVLKGDMSLVGPRPEIPHFVEQFKEIIPLYMVKHQVRPGITGWAQIKGYRGDTSIEKRIRCDIWYIENWSFDLDLQILFRTVFGGMKNNEK